MKLSVAMATTIFMLVFLTACIGDRASEAVDEFIEDAMEDALGTPTPQSGGVFGSSGSQCAYRGFFRRRRTKD